MHQKQVSADGVSLSGEDFRRAKVDHFLDRAAEFVSMGRLLAARRPLSSALNLDPENQQARDLMREVSRTLSALRDEVVAAGQPQPRRHEVVLVVDQDERLLPDMMKSLHRFGFRAVAAGGYKEASDLLALLTPQMIISEVNFEDGPVGFDLYLMVRTNAKLEGVPFLFLATKVDRETLIAGKRLGVSDFITKPLDEEVVFASIMSALSRSKRG